MCIFKEAFQSSKMNYSHPRRSTLAIRPIKLALFALAIRSLLLSSFVSAATPTQHTFHIQDQWNVGGAGGWSHLLLDAPAHRLYISRANRIMVVDTETGKVAGEVEGLTSARGIALDGASKFGYVTDLTDGTAGFVRVFDRSSLKLIASIPTGADPDALVFAPASNAVLAFNTRGHSATLIDTATNQVAATIPLPGRPAHAVVDSAGTVFATIPHRRGFEESYCLLAACALHRPKWSRHRYRTTPAADYLRGSQAYSHQRGYRSCEFHRSGSRRNRRYRLRPKAKPPLRRRYRRNSFHPAPGITDSICQAAAGKDATGRQNDDRKSSGPQSLPRHLEVWTEHRCNIGRTSVSSHSGPGHILCHRRRTLKSPSGATRSSMQHTTLRINSSKQMLSMRH